MKKRIVIGMMVLLCIVGCGKQSATNSNTTMTIDEEDKPTIKEKKCIYNDGHYVVEEYDENGNELSSTTYNKDGSIKYTSTYEYDKDGNLLLNVSVNEDGESTRREYAYDDNGNLVESHSDYGEIGFKDVYIYDENNNLIREENYQNKDNEETLSTYYVYEYDDDGKLQGKTNYAESDYVLKSYTYEYDEEGNLKLEVDRMYETTTRYLYDEQGNVLCESYIDKDGNLEFYRMNEYCEYGATEDYYYSEKNGLNYTKYKYDSNGNMTSVVRVDKDGNENETAWYSYDENGNLIEYDIKQGYHYNAEYNEYGDPVWVHDVCTDITRNAGCFDVMYTCEYIYY